MIVQGCALRSRCQILPSVGRVSCTLDRDDKPSMTTTCTKVAVLPETAGILRYVQINIRENMSLTPILFLALLGAGHCAARWVELRRVASLARCRVSTGTDAAMTVHSFSQFLQRIASPMSGFMQLGFRTLSPS